MSCEARLIPFRDDNPTRTFPIVVVAIIAANIAVYMHQLLLPDAQRDLFVYTYAAIPAVLLGRVDLAHVLPTQLRHIAVLYDLPVSQLEPVWLTIFTSMFLHGGLLHLGGNMLYLWVFGNNIEDTLGHARFLLFYLLCGLLAAALQIALSLRSPVPMVGASGAIAGVLGAYYVKYPRARVQTLVFFFFITIIWVPASLYLFIWFLFQILESVGAVGRTAASGGVAVFAHIGGFIAGYLLIRRLEPRRRRLRRADWWQ